MKKGGKDEGKAWRREGRMKGRHEEGREG